MQEVGRKKQTNFMGESTNERGFGEKQTKILKRRRRIQEIIIVKEELDTTQKQVNLKN